MERLKYGVPCFAVSKRNIFENRPKYRGSNIILQSHICSVVHIVLPASIFQNPTEGNQNMKKSLSSINLTHHQKQGNMLKFHGFEFYSIFQSDYFNENIKSPFIAKHHIHR